MVVCKCRKATKLYCFVHKAPVCGECICFTEHQICVVRSYSEWVIDGEYDWPPTCYLCQAVLEDGSDSQTTRLGCLHVIHTNCLVSYLRSFPPHTAPAGYVCPTCSTPIWPPKSIKDSGSCLHSKLKEAIMQTGLDKNLFGNHPVPLPTSEPHNTPSASSSAAQEGRYMTESYSPATGIGSSNLSAIDIVEIDDPSSAGDQFISNHGPNFVKSTSPAGNTSQTGATTRKGAYHVDRQNSEISYFSDDVYGTSKKYTRRGPFSRKFLRALIPFWSSALPTLPITAPPRKDMSNTVDVSEGRLRHHQRSSRMDPRKILLVIAIMACMATMGILYYRLAQRSLGENQPDDEQQ